MKELVIIHSSIYSYRISTAPRTKMSTMNGKNFQTSLVNACLNRIAFSNFWGIGVSSENASQWKCPRRAVAP